MSIAYISNLWMLSLSIALTGMLVWLGLLMIRDAIRDHTLQAARHQKQWLEALEALLEDLADQEIL